MNDQTPVTGRAVAHISAGAPVAGIVPTTIEDAFRLAKLIHASGLAPYQLKTPEAVAVVLMKGLEIGLAPMAALECIGVINGKAALHSDGIPALLWSRGFKIKEWYENEGDLDKIVAHCEITRPEGDKYTGTYSAKDAKDNGLWDMREKNNKGEPNTAPWFRFKKRMVKMRCRGWLARDCAADVLKGMPIFEEQRDIEEARRVEPRDITPKRAALELPDLTDEPAPAAEPAVLDVPDIEETPDEPLADAKGFLEKLREERGFCESEQDVADLAAANADMIARLSPTDQAEAQLILDGEDA